LYLLSFGKSISEYNSFDMPLDKYFSGIYLWLMDYNPFSWIYSIYFQILLHLGASNSNIIVRYAEEVFIWFLKVHSIISGSFKAKDHPYIQIRVVRIYNFLVIAHENLFSDFYWLILDIARVSFNLGTIDCDCPK
jgi:hypothetical protein